MADRNIKLLIEYDGSDFAGWQIQKKQRTIQGELTDAIRRVTGKEITLIGAGRTDTGVHARGQVANFVTDHALEVDRYCDAINYYLPDSILIRKSEEVDLGFHSRYKAKHRRYRYLLSSENSALFSRLRWERPGLIEIELLKQSAEQILGEHDFGSFCVTASLKDDNSCQIYHSKWRKIGPLLVFEIRGNRFLHSMVRSLVGAMVNLASVKKDNHPRNLTLGSFRDMFSAQVRDRNQFTAPARGLYLVSVAYGENEERA